MHFIASSQTRFFVESINYKNKIPNNNSFTRANCWMIRKQNKNKIKLLINSL